MERCCMQAGRIRAVCAYFEVGFFQGIRTDTLSRSITGQTEYHCQHACRHWLQHWLNNRCQLLLKSQAELTPTQDPSFAHWHSIYERAMRVGADNIPQMRVSVVGWADGQNEQKGHQVNTIPPHALTHTAAVASFPLYERFMLGAVRENDSCLLGLFFGCYIEKCRTRLRASLYTVHSQSNSIVTMVVCCSTLISCV